MATPLKRWLSNRPDSDQQMFPKSARQERQSPPAEDGGRRSFSGRAGVRHARRRAEAARRRCPASPGSFGHPRACAFPLGIGREILSRQESEGWGAKIIDRLSPRPRARLPGNNPLAGPKPQIYASVRRGVARRRICATGCCTIALRHIVRLFDAVKAAPV